MRKGTRKIEKGTQRLRERNWLLQFQTEFFEDCNGHRGTEFIAECYCACNQSKFKVFLLKRRDALIKKYRKRNQSRKTAKAAAAGAKVLLKEKNLAVAVSAKSQKASKVVGPTVEPPQRSQQELELLRQKRRDRKIRKKVAAVDLRNTNIVATVVFLKHLTDVAIRRVVKKVNTEVSELLNGSANIGIDVIKSKGMSLRSKSMPRRKRSARKSGSSI